MSRIVRLEAENIKRVIAVDITPTGNLVEITGKNGQGKTSVLDAIWWALGGARHVQAQPIRAGAERAKITVDLGDLVVTRTFKRKGDDHVTTTLTVETADGQRSARPQDMLESLMGALTFDPLEFVRMDAKGQAQTLRSFVSDFDFDAAAAANKADFEKRTIVNRRAKEARAAAMAISVPPGTPNALIDEDALTRKLAEIAERNDGVRDDHAMIRDMRAQVERLERSADTNERDAEALEERARLAREAAASDRKKAFALDSEINAIPDPGPLLSADDITAEIAEARLVNAAVRKREERDKLIAQARAAEKDAEALSDAMALRDRAKADAIKAAALPIDGLEFGADEIALNGVPFSQASDAEQLRTSIAVAMAMNPKLRVLRVRDGSLLDDDAMALIADMARENDFQVWVETVASDRPGAVVIEDGKVKE